MIYLVELQARPGQASLVIEQLRQLRESTAREPGAVAYLIHRAVDDADRVVLYERYADQASADAHMASEPVQKALEAFDGLLASPPRLTLLAAEDGFVHAA